MAKYFTLSSPLSRCPYTFFSEDREYLSLFLSSLCSNNTSLFQKQHVVFNKTTRCFQQNDTLFSIKRHVVFNKTTRCFFYRIQHRSKKILPLVADRNSIIFPSLSILLFESANFSKKPFSHARVRARLTGVFTFLLSQVSQILHKLLCINSLRETQTFFNH